MSNEELKAKLSELIPTATFEEGGEWTTLLIEPKALMEVMPLMRNDVAFNMDYLFCLTAVDWKTHITMVYHLTSTTYRHNLVIKSKLDKSKPEIETVCLIWRSAEFLEREVYELFGVNFINHPDLRLLILPDGWEGKNPLLKDFDDPINMIKL